MTNERDPLNAHKFGKVAPMSKTSPGNFFEDFRIGQVIRHATPRTVTTGDVALYNGLFGPRFAPQSSDAFARAIGYPHERRRGVRPIRH